VAGRLPEDPQRLANYLAEHNPPCPRCGYCLEGLASRICPECGQELSINAFLRAKRRKTNMPGWLEMLTKAGGVGLFSLVLLILFGGLVSVVFGTRLVSIAQIACVVVIVVYGVCILGWYWWGHRR